MIEWVFYLSMNSLFKRVSKPITNAMSSYRIRIMILSLTVKKQKCSINVDILTFIELFLIEKTAYFFQSFLLSFLFFGDSK